MIGIRARNLRTAVPSRTSAIYLLLLSAAVGAFVLSLLSGSVNLSFQELWHGMTGENSLAHAVLFELRLPRTLTAFAAGGLLAIAGVLMQVLLRNPLADPGCYLCPFPRPQGGQPRDAGGCQRIAQNSHSIG